MEIAVNQPMAQLAGRLKSHPGDEVALFGLFKAVRDQGLVEELVVLLDVWAEAEHDDGLPEQALAELTFRIALRSPDSHARRLCRIALDVCPGHLRALVLFDSLTDESLADEVSARYQLFLEVTAPHGISEDTREAVVDRMMQTGRHETQPSSPSRAQSPCRLVPWPRSAETAHHAVRGLQHT
jgi:hypothetical protein